jgi:DKNYY family
MKITKFTPYLIIVIVALLLIGSLFVHKKEFQSSIFNKKVISEQESIPVADAVASQVVDTSYNIYKTESGSVYYGSTKIEADPLTFVIIPDCFGYTKDKYNIFYQGKKIINIDINSFICFENGIAKDVNNVYYEGEILKNISSTGFIYSGDKAFILSKNGEPLSYGLDVNNFTQINGAVLKNKESVYAMNEYSRPQGFVQVPDINASKFKLIGLCASAEKASANYYSDTVNMYVDSVGVPGEYPLTAVKGIDMRSFAFLGNYENGDGMSYSLAYAKDKKYVYVGCGDKLKNADVLTFTDLKSGYAEDKNYIWYFGREIKNADPETFTVLQYGFAKDKKNMYLGGFLIKTINSSTAQLIIQNIESSGPNISIKDKNKTYSYEEIQKLTQYE